MDQRDYDLFELRIQHDNAIEAVLKTHDDLETRVPDTNNPTKVSDDKYLRDDIAKGILKLKAGQLDGLADDIQKLGRDLYRALFPGKIGETFEQAIKNVLTERQRGNKKRWLRVIVDVHPKSDVFEWPLEFLYCDPQNCWLATDKPLIALSRHTTFGGTVDLSRQRPPLRVLVVISKPENMKGVMTTKVLEEIGKLAGKAGGSGEEESPKMDVKVLGNVKDYERIPGIEYLNQGATYGNLRELTSGEWQPHVLHFIGHGKFEPDKQGGVLILVDDDGKADPCSANHISKLFTADWHPRLVLLQACESAASGTEPGFMSLAAYLVSQNIQAVVAMQFAIRNDYATKFATGFYEALRDGLDVDSAVQNGRWKISNALRWGKRYFGAPVLFMYSPDGIILPLSSKLPESVSRTYGQPEGSGASKPATQDAGRTLDKALGWLGDKGHAVDRGQAIILMEVAFDALQEVRPSEAEILNDAIECLRDQQNVNRAMQMLRNVQRLLGTPSTIRPIAEVVTFPVRVEQEKTPDSTVHQVQTQPAAVPLAAVSKPPTWAPESERKDDRAD